MSAVLESWIELSPHYFTNQPPKWIGRGKNRHTIPDPEVEPTTAYLLIREGKRFKTRTTYKTRCIELHAENGTALTKAVEDYAKAPGVYVWEERI
jgi:hypothetical protein